MRDVMRLIERGPAWMWLAGLALIFLVRFPIHFAPSPVLLMDFEVYRAAAQLITDGRAAHLYEPAVSNLMMFKYAPIWAVAWLPLAWVPAQAGALLWLTGSVLWLVLACAGSLWLCRHAGLPAPGWLAAAAVLVLVRPLSAEFLNGQTDLLWAALVIGFLVAEAAGRPWWAAASLAAAISLKLPALIYLGYLLVRRRLRTAAAALGLVLAVNLAACAVLTPSDPLRLIRSWLAVLRSSGASRAFEIGNQSLLALGGRLLSADGYQLNLVSLPSAGVALLIGLASAALLIWALRWPGRTPSPSVRFVFEAALLGVLMVLCSPTVWVATYSALLFPVTLAAAWARAHPTSLWRDPASAMAACGAVACSVMTHSTFWKAVGIVTIRGESYVFLVLMVLPWLGLCLFVYLARIRRYLT